MPCQTPPQNEKALNDFLAQDKNQTLESSNNLTTELDAGSERSQDTSHSEMSPWDSSDGYPFSDEENDDIQKELDEYIQKSIDEQLQKQFEEQIEKERRSLEKKFNDRIDRSLEEDMARMSLDMRDKDNSDFYFNPSSCSNPTSGQGCVSNATLTNHLGTALHSSGEEKVTVQEVDKVIKAVIERYKDQTSALSDESS